MSDRPVVIKSPSEIAVMREAGRINARALQAVHDIIRPGVTTAEMDALAEDVIRQHGGTPAFKNYPGPFSNGFFICYKY